MRPLTLRRMRPSERRILRAKLRTPTLPVRLHHRYRIIAEVARGHAGPLIADRVGCDVDTVYVWVHRFNTSGIDTFERPPNPKGREPILTTAQVRALVTVALSRPVDLGLPFTEWSTAKLAAYCRARGLLPAITDEWVRRVLRREGITPQRLKTWKQSPDPAFEAKKTRILRLYERQPRGGAVICFDEWGPLELCPIPGIGLARRSHPRRQRATSHRTQGTEQFLGFSDVHDDCLMGECRRRKTFQDLLVAFRQLRACYPRHVRLYVVMDTDRHPLLRAFYQAHRITVVPCLPTPAGSISSSPTSAQCAVSPSMDLMTRAIRCAGSGSAGTSRGGPAGWAAPNPGCTDTDPSSWMGTSDDLKARSMTTSTDVRTSDCTPEHASDVRDELGTVEATQCKFGLVQRRARGWA